LRAGRGPGSIPRPRPRPGARRPARAREAASRWARLRGSRGGSRSPAPSRGSAAGPPTRPPRGRRGDQVEVVGDVQSAEEARHPSPSSTRGRSPRARRRRFPHAAGGAVGRRRTRQPGALPGQDMNGDGKAARARRPCQASSPTVSTGRAGRPSQLRRLLANARGRLPAVLPADSVMARRPRSRSRRRVRPRTPCPSSS